jgi:hypothetical protein
MTTASTDHAQDGGKVFQLEGKPGVRKKPVAKDKREERWIPVPEDVFQIALQIRAQVQKQIKMRPDVSIVIAALIEHASHTEGVTEAVARYGLDRLSKSVSPAPAAQGTASAA